MAAGRFYRQWIDCLAKISETDTTEVDQSESDISENEPGTETPGTGESD